MKLRIIVAALAICVGVTGCNVTGTGKFTDKEITSPNGVTREQAVEIGITISSNKMRGFTASSGVDVSDIAIDITGDGAAVLDGYGTGTLLVKQGGDIIGSTTFDYVVLDSMAVAADPATVNAWLVNYPSADGYDIELASIQTVDTESGIATLTAEAYYGSTEITSISTSWASGAGGGCSGSGGNDGNPFPEQPIELPGEGPCP